MRTTERGTCSTTSSTSSRQGNSSSTKITCGYACFPFSDIEKLLQGFERNINDHPRAALLKGDAITFALIAEQVWKDITQSERATDASDARDLPGLLEIYQGDPAGAVSRSLHDLSVVDSFVTGCAITWHADDNPSQHYGDDMRQFLDEATQRVAVLAQANALFASLVRTA